MAAWGIPPDQLDAPAVQVGDETLSVRHVLSTYGPGLRRWAEVNGEDSAREKLRELLIRQQYTMLLWHAAEEAGYDRAPEVVQARKEAMVGALTDALVAEQGTDLHEVTPAQLRAYHAAHAEEFTEAEAVRAAHVVMQDEQAAQQLLERLLAAEDPNTVFAEIGIARVKNLGLIPRDPTLPAEPAPGRRHAPELPGPLREAVMECEKQGQILPRVVRSDRGFHIVRCTGFRKSGVIPAGRMVRTLETRIRKERQDATYGPLLSRLEKEAGLKVHAEHLQQVRLAD